jgi:phosphatidylglycerophosphate synthase
MEAVEQKSKLYTIIRDSLQKVIYKILHPFVRFLIRIGCTPNTITTIGLVLNLSVAVIFILGTKEKNIGDLSYVGWAGAMILFAGVFDMLDGQVARLGNMASRFGALYDSVLDRYSELVMFFGITYYLVSHDYFLSSVFSFLALIGSMMVSYTRARAEGFGIECKEGLMQRPERVVIIGVSALACGITASIVGSGYAIYYNEFPVFEVILIFTFPLAIVAVLSNVTAVQRLIHCKNELEKNDTY